MQLKDLSVKHNSW